MCTTFIMDVSSLRGLLTLVIQLHTMIIFAQTLSEEGTATRTKSKGDSNPKPCCLNGGLCVLGSFCHCPKNYHGRYCEYEVSQSRCGHIPHGSWVKAGCNLCQCSNGHMNCLPRAFDGCDDKPMDEKIDPWDYKDEMIIFAKDTSTSKYDAMDDDYADYYDSFNSGARTLQSLAATSLVASVALTIALTQSWSLVS